MAGGAGGKWCYGGTPRAVSQAIVEKARDLALEPFKAPEPLPPIDEDDVALVCWMGVEVA